MRILLVLLLAATLSAADKKTALDLYVEKPDPTYAWKVNAAIPCDDCTAHVLDMTSQTWRTAAEVDKPVWKHWLTVIRPSKITSRTALLFISGGSNTSRPAAKADAMLSSVAKDTGMIVAELRGIPSEPLKFAGESKTRNEDAIIAYTWDKHLRGGDQEWPLRLPMTKAAVRALDTVTAFTKTAEGGGEAVEKFIVAGASKRGWTTWTTAVVDKRVIAIVPIVIDMLNLEPSFNHHWRVYGFWAPSVGDYTAMKIMDWSGTPQYKKLLSIVEPFSYRSRLTMPKYIVNAAGDQFFVPDSSQFYFDQLKGEKYLRYVPNADHSLRNSDAVAGLAAFQQMVAEGKPRPSFTWKFQKDGSIQVKTKDKPTEVKLWQATNPDARDFRLEKIGRAWKSTNIEGNGTYTASVPKPEKGWTAYFIELTYPGPGKHPLKVTTGVRVNPDVYPFPAPVPDRSVITTPIPPI